MELFYRITADLVVVLHFAYVAFVVAGLLLVLLGYCRGWSWIRNVWFRSLHLAMIGVVVVQAWLGITCPLTVWENQLRTRAGEAEYPGGFFAHWVHEILFFEVPQEALSALYTLFGLAVILTFVLAPPRRSRPLPPKKAPRESRGAEGETQ